MNKIDTISFYFILFHSISFYFILFHSISYYFILYLKKNGTSHGSISSDVRFVLCDIPHLMVVYQRGYK